MTTAKHLTVRAQRSRQQGSALIEILISMLIFSIAALGIIGLQASSTRQAGDAKYRGDAALLADRLIGDMWVADPATRNTFANRAGGGGCAPTGQSATAPSALSWLTSVADALPGASADKQQVTFDPATGIATITLCWNARVDSSGYNGPAPDTAMHRYTVSAQIVNN